MTRGHRLRGGFSGFLFGLGVTILLQQFAIVPFTLPVVLAVPIGMVLLGVAIGWPRRERTS